MALFGSRFVLRSTATAVVQVALVLCCADSAAAQRAQRGKSRKPAAAATVAPSAEDAAAAAAASAEAQKLDEAKAAFKQGNALRQAGEYQGALAYYLKSRALVPSAPNTINAAFCLGQLGRFDEALDMYEAVLVEFADTLTSEMRASFGPEMSRLREQTGGIEVDANVAGMLVIDSKPRGTLPLSGPVRVLPGAHTIRVLKEGYEPFEASVKVAATQTAPVRAELQPLKGSGRLRVEAPDLEGDEGAGAEVFIDGVSFGKTPWEGTLGPGAHVFFVRAGDTGSAPQTVTVVAGQTTLVRAKLAPLGGTTRVRVLPPGTKFIIDDVPLGPDQWEGRLPLGGHALAIRREGYHARQVALDTTGDDANVSVTLEIDPEHKMWAKPSSIKLWLEALAGGALSPVLGSGSEQACDRDASACTDAGLPLGLFAGARVGLRFDFGLDLELSGGYLRVQTTVKRTVEEPFNRASGAGAMDVVPATYALSETTLLAGTYVTGGLGYSFPLGKSFRLGARTHFGVAVALASQAADASISTEDESIPATVDGSSKSVDALPLLLWPELYGRLAFGRWHVGLGLGALFVLTEGPAGPLGDIYPARGPGDACSVPATGNVPLACIKGSDAVEDARTFGTPIVFAPNLQVGYTL